MADDRCLWSKYVAGIERIRNNKVCLFADSETKDVAGVRSFAGGSVPRAYDIGFERHMLKRDAVSPPVRSMGALLTPRRLKKLKSGVIRPEIEVDYHGYDLFRMEKDLAASLPVWRYAGKRLALIVTGKGTGVLQRELPRLLEAPNNMSHIAGFESASDSSFYVYLRKVPNARSRRK